MKILFYLFVLVLASTVLASNNILSFPNFIETGSYSFNTASYYGVLGYRILATTFNIPFANSKNEVNYNSALSIQGIDLDFRGNLLSLMVSVQSQSTSSLVISLRSWQGNHLNTLSVRFLVVLAQYYFIDIVEIATNSQLNFSLYNGHPYSINQTISTINSSVSTISIYLSGFNVTTSSPVSNDLDFTPQITATNTSLLLTVYSANSNWEAIQLDYVSYSVLIFDQSSMFKNNGGVFINDYQASTFVKSITYANSSTVIYSNASFFGIRAFHIVNYNTFEFTSTLTLSSITLSSSRWYDYLVMSWAIFIISCDSTKFIQLNNTCVAACTGNQFGNLANNICQVCDSNCLTCSSSSITCTKCMNTSYLTANNVCVLCDTALIYCTICSSSSICSTCQSLTLLNSLNQCDPDCSLILLCTVCNLIQSNIECQTCQNGYIVQNNICIPKCGDGIILGNEQCDDGNNAISDGCSSTCQIQHYWNCLGTPSICFLNQIQFIPLCFLKSSKSNEVVMSYKIQPASLSAYTLINWTVGFFLVNERNVAIQGINYDFGSSTLSITTAYTQNINEKIVNFILDCSLFGASSFSHISPMSLSCPSTTDNNLSIQYYGDNIYAAASILQYLSIIAAVLSLIFFIMGNVGSKLIALQCCAVIQISSISLLTLKNISPFFNSLRWLHLSFGYNQLTTYQYVNNNLNREFKGQSLSVYSLQNYNIILITIFLPPLLAAIIKILSVTLLKQKLQLQTTWKYLLGETTLYGALFCSYSILISFFISMRFYHIDLIATVTGIIAGFIFLSLLIGLTIASNKYPKLFKQFKSKFQILNICQYFYNFEVAERIVVSAFIVFLTNESFQAIFIIIIIIAKLVFIVIRKPYVLGDWKRATANLIITLVILILFLICKLIKETSYINLIAPCIILGLLFVCLIYNGYLMACELKQKCETYSENDSSRFQIIEYTPQQIEKVRFETFEKQMLPTNQEALMQIIQQSMGNFNREMINYEWMHYPDLSRSKILDKIKGSIQKQKQKTDNIELVPIHKDSI